MSDQQQLDVGVSPESDPDADTSRPQRTPGASDPDPDPDYPGGESRETRYFFAEAVCENHPSPPGPCEEGHLHASAVLIDGSDDFEALLVDKLGAVPCGVCETALEPRTVRGTWPPEDPTPEDVLEVFRETRGQIVLTVYPDDFDRRFYVGEIGGRYDVRTEAYDRPSLPTGVDDLPDLVRNHPTTLESVDETPLEGLYEDYKDGVL